MPFNTALSENLISYNEPTKKQKLEANTPLKYFLRPILEEAMRRRTEAMQMNQQMPMNNPLQGALQQGGAYGGLQQTTPINQGY